MELLENFNVGLRRFDYGKDFFVIIEDKDNLYNVYLGHNNYGILDYMFGVHHDSVKDYCDLLDVIDANIEDDIEIYRDRFMDEDKYDA